MSTYHCGGVLGMFFVNCPPKHVAVLIDVGKIEKIAETFNKVNEFYQDIKSCIEKAKIKTKELNLKLNDPVSTDLIVQSFNYVPFIFITS
jgi:hypothetical protein